MFRLPTYGSGNIFEECSPNRKSRQHINMYECCLKTFWQMFCICYRYVVHKHFHLWYANVTGMFLKTFFRNVRLTEKVDSLLTCVNVVWKRFCKTCLWHMYIITKMFSESVPVTHAKHLPKRFQITFIHVNMLSTFSVRRTFPKMFPNHVEIFGKRLRIGFRYVS